MIRIQQRWLGTRPQASRSGATARLRRSHWALEQLEGRVLLSGSPTIYTVDLTSDTGTSTSTDAGDLLYCVSHANVNPNIAGSEIQFDPTVFNPVAPKTITLASTLDLSETAGPEMIDGPGASAVMISGNNAVQVFDASQQNTTASLAGLTISGGMTNQSGGGIDNEGTLAVTDCTIENSSASSGGGINNDGTLTLTDCTIASNSAQFGAGVYNDGTLSVTGSSIETNSASGFGGGIDNSDGEMATLTNTTFDDNSAVFKGGGIINSGGTKLSVTGGTFSTNSAESGGGIYLEGDGGDPPIPVPISDSTFSGNMATGTSGNSGGGGIYNDGGTATLTGSTLSSNSAFNTGGGIYQSSGALTITDSTVSDNSVSAANSSGTGGGIAENFGTLTITNSTIAGNSAQNVGAGIQETSGTLTAVNCTIAYNMEPSTGAGFGGGIDITDGTATLNNTIIALNTDGTTSNAPPDNLYLDGNGTVSMASANNLIGAGGGNSGLTNGSNGNQVGVANPGLGTLASNGGPTETIALLAGSPAIDSGSNALAVDPHGSPLTTDQRGAGFPRIVNGTVDIGAFEVQTPTTDNPVPTLSSIQPDRAPAGDTLPISLTVTGSNFLSQSVVYWNTTALSTTFVSSTDVTATVPSSDLTSVGSASITVTTPPLGGGTSAALPFTVVGAPPRSVYVSSAYTGDSTDTPVTWVDGSTHYVGFDAFATIPPAVAALASGGTINILQTGGTDYSGSPDSGNNGLVLSVDNTFTPAGTVPAADTLAFAGDGFVTIFGESAPMNDVFTITDTSVQFDAADGLHGMTIDLAPTVNRDVLGLGNTNTFNIEGLGDSGSSGYLIGNADSSSNAFVFGPFGELLGNIDGSGTNTLNYSAYDTPVTVNLGNGTNGTATGVSGTVAGITAVIGSNNNDTLSAGSVPGVALTGGLGTNNLSGTGAGDSVVESIASSYTLTNTALTGAGASFTDNLSGIRVASLTGSSGFGDSFDVSGWTGTGSLDVSSGFSVVTATKNANMTVNNSALVASDGMSLSLSHIVIAELTATASAGDPKDIIDASAFSGFAALSATGTVNAVLYGGSGAGDTLTAAGSGNDILIGDAGRDTLIDTGTGHNIMIGPGSGGNTVTGNGNDILVGGTTVYDGNSGSNIAALDTILAEWASNAPYAKRISTIGKGVGFKRRVALNSRTIQADANANSLSDGRTQPRNFNWFLASRRDSVTKKRNETRTII